MSDDAKKVTLHEGREIVDASVGELLGAIRHLLADEESRASSLNSRGSGLTGFIGVILSVAAAAGAGLTVKGLDHWARVVVGVLVGIAFLVLVIAVVLVVARVLVPTDGVAISVDEAQKFPTWEFIARPQVMIQGHLMRGYLRTLARDRQRNNTKALWLRISYILVTVGLILVAAAGAVATLDRYVRAPAKQPGAPGKHATIRGEPGSAGAGSAGVGTVQRAAHGRSRAAGTV